MYSPLGRRRSGLTGETGDLSSSGQIKKEPLTRCWRTDRCKVATPVESFDGSAPYRHKRALMLGVDEKTREKLGNPKCFTCKIKSQYRRTRRELFPVLSRIQNIGYDLGENGRTPEWYRANHRAPWVAGQLDATEFSCAVPIGV